MNFHGFSWISHGFPLDFPMEKPAVFRAAYQGSTGSTPYLKQLDLELAMPLEQQRHLRELRSLELALMLGTGTGSWWDIFTVTR